ncbi:unnamed protein product, partial [marine sediment metagenome]
MIDLHSNGKNVFRIFKQGRIIEYPGVFKYRRLIPLFQIRNGYSEVALKYKSNIEYIKQKNAEVVTDAQRMKSLFV